jgi:hypothetical protein
MNKYVFIGSQESTNSSSYSNQINMVNCSEDKYKYYFTVYDSDQVKCHPYATTIMLDEVSGEFTQNAKVKYCIEFDNYLDGHGNKIYGKIIKNSLAKFGVSPQYDNMYKLEDNWCKGALMFNQNGTAQMERYGSGIHYQQIIKGRVESIV